MLITHFTKIHFLGFFFSLYCIPSQFSAFAYCKLKFPWLHFDRSTGDAQGRMIERLAVAQFAAASEAWGREMWKYWNIVDTHTLAWLYTRDLRQQQVCCWGWHRWGHNIASVATRTTHTQIVWSHSCFTTSMLLEMTPLALARTMVVMALCLSFLTTVISFVL